MRIRITAGPTDPVYGSEATLSIATPRPINQRGALDGPDEVTTATSITAA